MPELRAITESSHLARTAAARLVERVHDVMWWLARRPLPMVLLREQQPLAESELHRANSIIDWIEQVIEARPEYLEPQRLDARMLSAQHFRYRQDLHSRLVGSLTQGTAHLWGKQALPPFGEHRPTRPVSFRPAAKHREFHSVSAPISRVDCIHSSSR
jgi:hypothetical protein